MRNWVRKVCCYASSGTLYTCVHHTTCRLGAPDSRSGVGVGVGFGVGFGFGVGVGDGVGVGVSFGVGVVGDGDGVTM